MGETALDKLLKGKQRIGHWSLAICLLWLRVRVCHWAGLGDPVRGHVRLVARIVGLGRRLPTAVAAGATAALVGAVEGVVRRAAVDIGDGGGCGGRGVCLSQGHRLL